MTKRIALALLLLMIFSLTSGCIGPQTPASSNSEETPVAQGDSTAPELDPISTPEGIEQRLVYSMSSEPIIMDPGLNYYLAPSNVIQNVFRGLYKLDQEGNVAPAVALSHTVDETGTVYTFYLREDAVWSNGEPITAYDFEFSWKRVVDPETGTSTAYALESIKNAIKCANGELPMDEFGAKALDEYTFEVTLEAPTAWFIDLITTPTFMPVYEGVVDNAGSWAFKAETFVCNGPFMITEMKPDEKYVLKKNPLYFDAEGVKLETIEIVFMESAESTFIAYNNDDIHFTQNISLEAKERYFGTEEYNASPVIGVAFNTFNCAKPPFDDVRVREAFTIAINRQDILDYVLESPEVPAYAYVPIGYYNPANPDEFFRDSVGYDFITEDIEKAQKLLADAGFPNGEGMPEIVFMTDTSQLSKDMAQALQEMWKTNLGVTVEIVTHESKIVSEQARLGNFNIVTDGWTGLYPDPMSIMQPLDYTDPETATLQTFHSMKIYHDHLMASITELDQEKRMNLFMEMEKIILEELPVMPMYYRSNLYLCKPNAKNVIKNIIGHTYLEYAYME